tara:strand:- start:487 stop:969 length:483 start_codon:yes stop_codon:yes gene_type:complete
MIITCPNCNKQFQIDNSLIPDEGRDLQCGSCNNVWFYKIVEENSEILKLKEEIIKQETEAVNVNKEEKIAEKKESTEKVKTEKNKFLEKDKGDVLSENTKNKGSKLFSYLIVFIISIVALIILLDTVKNPLINVFPRLEILLFNLFETLKDIKLFIIDLI